MVLKKLRIRVRSHTRKIGRKKVRVRGHTRMIYVKKRQVGARKNVKRDRARKALPPGKRKTAWGSTYYEYRRNRSDLKGKKI